jgi:hypothetical protein
MKRRNVLRDDDLLAKPAGMIAAFGRVPTFSIEHESDVYICIY